MAETPISQLSFKGRCPDCGIREVELPAALPDAGDDFDWRVRDYDGYRMFMLEELSARFPERTRWTPADLEVVLVEAFATVLDQLSDMQDRVATEMYLETARRASTVRQLLKFIGYDAVSMAKKKDYIASELEGDDAIQALEDYWRANPFAMDREKRAGPRAIHTQKRMVTTEDYAIRLREHPLVVQANAWTEWSGSWLTVHIAVIAWNNSALDSIGTDSIEYSEDIKLDVVNFYEGVGLVSPDINVIPAPSIRMLLQPYIDAFRMTGQEVVLQDPVYVGIYMALSIRVADNFYQSEMCSAITHQLGNGPGGFFEPGKHGFGEDLYASDIVEALMALDGIENVCLNRFKRIGSQYLDNVETGYISLDGLEVAVCDNDTENSARGYYRLALHGGRKG